MRLPALTLALLVAASAGGCGSGVSDAAYWARVRSTCVIGSKPVVAHGADDVSTAASAFGEALRRRERLLTLLRRIGGPEAPRGELERHMLDPLRDEMTRATPLEHELQRLASARPRQPIPAALARRMTSLGVAEQPVNGYLRTHHDLGPCATY